MAKKIDKRLKQLETFKANPDLAILKELQDVGDVVDDLKDSFKDIDLRDVPEIKGDQGVQGEKGDEGEKGDKGDKGEKGDDGKDGKKGLDGMDGLDGLDGEDGQDGKSLSEEEIEKLETNVALSVESQIPGMIADHLPEVDTSKLRLDASQIDNLPRGGRSGPTAIDFFAGGVRAGSSDALDITAGTGMTVTPTKEGNRITYTLASTGGAGDITTDDAWTAKGDLIGGTGVDTAAILNVGTNGQFLTADSAEATGMKWTTASGTGDLLADGTVPLTANWDVGAFTIQGTQFISDIAIGTAPLVVTSTTVVPNLNADLLDGNQATAFATALGADDNYVTDAEKIVIGNTSGTNSGDQTSIVGITGTKAQFDTAVTDGNIMYDGDAPTAHTHTESDISDLQSYLLPADIGTSVQAQGAVLDDLNTLGANAADSEFLVGTGVGALAWESGATARTSLGVDAAGTDNSTDVTLAGTPNYLTLSGQAITLTKLDVSDDTNLVAGTGLALSTNTLSVDLNELTTETTIASGDFISMVDITDSGSGKITFANLESTVSYNNIADTPTLGTASAVNTDLADLNEATIEGAIDTLANLTTIQGLTVTLADAGANAIFGWDDIAGAYENLSKAEALAVLNVEDGADVTDTANVTSAGALMDSELTDIAAVKATADCSIAEVDTGTDTAKFVTPDALQGSKRNIRWLVFNLVEAATDCTVATNIAGDFVSPIAGVIQQSDTTPFYLYATNSTAGVTGTTVVDISIGGTSIMTTNKLDFDTTEKTTTTAATPPDLTTTALAVGDIITIDVDSLSTTAPKGLTVYIAVLET